PKLTAEMIDNFQKVRPGMSEGEVVALLGKPTKTMTVPSTEVGGQRFPETKHLTWGEFFEQLTVTLQDGKVISGTGTVNGKVLDMPGGPPPPTPSPLPKLEPMPGPAPKPVDTKALMDGFGKVRAGMTEKQVVAVLGPPTQTAIFPAAE